MVKGSLPWLKNLDSLTGGKQHLMKQARHSCPSEDVILPSTKLLSDSLREFLSSWPEGEKELGLYSLCQGGRDLQVKQKRWMRAEFTATKCSAWPGTDAIVSLSSKHCSLVTLNRRTIHVQCPVQFYLYIYSSNVSFGACRTQCVN